MRTSGKSRSDGTPARANRTDWNPIIDLDDDGCITIPENVLHHEHSDLQHDHSPDLIIAVAGNVADHITEIRNMGSEFRTFGKQ